MQTPGAHCASVEQGCPSDAGQPPLVGAGGGICGRGPQGIEAKIRWYPAGTGSPVGDFSRARASGA